MNPLPKGVRIRRGVPDDLAFLRHLHAVAMRPHVEATWGTWDEAEQRRRFEASTEPTATDIVERGGEPIGCLWVRVHPDDLELVRIWLLPAAQGQGLGSALVRRLCERAGAAGRGVRLRVLRANPARRLYARLGFRPVEHTDSHVAMRWSPVELPNGA